MTFSPPIFITIGDEYDKKGSIPDRYKGPNMKCVPAKRGIFFQSKFLSLSEGDRYINPGEYERREKLEKAKKRLTPSGFKYSNPSHKGWSGMYFGTFSERSPPKHEVEYVVTQPGERSASKTRAHLKNFVTNPPKRGTYGFPNRTIGQDPKYISDPYEGERRLETMVSQQSTKKVLGAPFKSASSGGRFFDSNRSGVSQVYSLPTTMPARRVKSGDERKAPLLKAWKPGGTLVAAITKFPEYLEDPYEAKEKRLREERLKHKPLAKAWKPIGGGKTLPTKPIKFNPPA